MLKHYPSDIDMPDVNGRTPLMWAAWRGDIQSLDLLLNARGDTNRTDIDRKDREGYSALARAAEAGHLDCVRRLLEAGTSVHITDGWGLQPIHHACGNKANWLAIVEELLKKGADPNAPSENGTPLHEAANRGSLDTVKYLINSGADTDAQDSDGDTPAMVALVCWNESTFIYLAEAGAKLYLTDSMGMNVVNIAIRCASTGIWDAIIEFAREGRLDGLDLDAQHQGHDIHHCFHTCGDLVYVGKRRVKEEEERKFLSMIEELRSIIS